MGTKLLMGIMTLLTGATGGSSRLPVEEREKRAADYERKLELCIEEEKKQLDARRAAIAKENKAAMKEKKKADRKEQRRRAAIKKKEIREAAKAAKAQLGDGNEATPSMENTTEQEVEHSVADAASLFFFANPMVPSLPNAGPAVAESQGIDVSIAQSNSADTGRPRRLRNTTYASSRYDYAPSLAGLVNTSFAERQQAAEAERAVTFLERPRVVKSTGTAATIHIPPLDTSPTLDGDVGVAGIIDGESPLRPASGRKRAADEMTVSIDAAMAAAGSSSDQALHGDGGVSLPIESGSDGLQPDINRPRKRAAIGSRIIAATADSPGGSSTVTMSDDSCPEAVQGQIWGDRKEEKSERGKRRWSEVSADSSVDQGAGSSGGAGATPNGDGGDSNETSSLLGTDVQAADPTSANDNANGNKTSGENEVHSGRKKRARR